MSSASRDALSAVRGGLGGAALAVVVAFGSVAGQSVSSSLDEGASGFWLASTPEAVTAAVQELRSAGASFDAVYRALLRTPAYPDAVERGRLHRKRVDPDGVEYPYTLLVPTGYDPERAYPVLFYLHGGVNRPAWTEPGSWWRDYDRVADPDRVVVVPAGWRDASWWQASQMDNLRAILDEIGRTLHIDHDRVHVIGISDGGTGAYYQAFRSATPWASFISLIGHPAVLSSPRLAVDGQMHPANLRNRPLLIVNGGKDRLYPTSSVEPFVRLFRENGVRLVYRPRPEAGHDLDWWPEEEARIDSFLVATPRDPLPDALEWETEDPKSGRFSWIAIDALGGVDGEPELPDRNTLRVPGESRPYLAFPQRAPSGRVIAERSGNRVRLRTAGVTALRLLVSPEEFDLARPIQVEVNGILRFDGRVEPSLDTLFEWAVRDRDPHLLFAAEIPITP